MDAREEGPPTAEQAGSAEPVSKTARAKLLAATLKARKEELAERAELERGRHASVDALFEMVDRDGEFAGGIIAGALAYRLFIWFLPAALVAVAGLGIASSSSDQTPAQTAGHVGLSSLVTGSIASAATGNAHWYALIVGVPLVLYTTRSLLRALIAAHRILWADPRVEVPKPTVAVTLKLLLVLMALILVAGLPSTLRHWATGPGVIATAVGMLPVAAIWLYASYQLPHGGVRWTWLVPGAVVFAVGSEVIQVVATWFLGPYAASKEGTYGSLGLAAALLLGLFFCCRVVVLAAVVNATLAARRKRAVTAEAGSEHS